LSTFNNFSLDYSIQDQPFDLPLDMVSFSLIDSIYSIYRRATLQIPDKIGLFQEAYVDSPGIKHSIKFSQKNKQGVVNFVKGDFTVDKSQIESAATYGTSSGTLGINLQSWWKFNQQNVQTAYKDRISNIAKQVAMNYFTPAQLDVNDTGNQGVWLQADMTDGKFINDILLPNAFSQNASGAPFYAWEGNDGLFHFRNYLSLFRSVGQTDDDLFYSPQMADPTMDPTKVKNTVMDMRIFSKSQKYPNQNINFFDIARESGMLDITPDSILDHPRIPTLTRAQVLSPSARSEFLGLSRQDQADNFSGQQSFFFRDDLLSDKKMVVLPSCLTLNAGNKVSLTVLANQSQQSNPSYRHSGEYIIELSEQIWSAVDKMGYTRLLLSRNAQNVPSDAAYAGSFPL
jgi:hypothetical protein